MDEMVVDKESLEEEEVERDRLDMKDKRKLEDLADSLAV